LQKHAGAPANAAADVLAGALDWDVPAKNEPLFEMWLLVAKDRDVARYREEGRFSNAPDTKQQKDLARTKADDVPVLMLLRQKGDEARGWRGLPFWWPVIMTPRSGVTAIFAMDEAVPPTAPTAAGPTRSLSTEEIA
jgi:hypothetical protein